MDKGCIVPAFAWRDRAATIVFSDGTNYTQHAARTSLALSNTGVKSKRKVKLSP
jgi:hypothetical protein